MTAELANCHNEMAQQHAALQTPCSSSTDSTDTARTDQESISFGERNLVHTNTAILRTASKYDPLPVENEKETSTLHTALKTELEETKSKAEYRVVTPYRLYTRLPDGVKDSVPTTITSPPPPPPSTPTTPSTPTRRLPILTASLAATLSALFPPLNTTTCLNDSSLLTDSPDSIMRRMCADNSTEPSSPIHPISSYSSILEDPLKCPEQSNTRSTKGSDSVPGPVKTAPVSHTPRMEGLFGVCFLIGLLGLLFRLTDTVPQCSNLFDEIYTYIRVYV